MGRRLLALLGAVALVVVVVGCQVDVHVEVVMDRGGAGTITVTASADADLVAQAPGLAADLRFDDLVAAGWAVDGPTPSADGGLEVVAVHSFAAPEEATALLAQLNGAGGPFQGLTLTRVVDGDRTTYAADGTLQLVGGIDAFSDAYVQSLGAGTPFADTLAQRGQTVGDALAITLDLTLPASTTSNGVADGDSARWQVPMDGSAAVVEATASSEPSTGWARLLAVLALSALVAWVVVAAAFVVYVVRQRRGTLRR